MQQVTKALGSLDLDILLRVAADQRDLCVTIGRPVMGEFWNELAIILADERDARQGRTPEPECSPQALPN